MALYDHFVESMLMSEKHLRVRPEELGNLCVQILNAQIFITLQHRVIDLEGLEAVDEETFSPNKFEKRRFHDAVD